MSPSLMDTGDEANSPGSLSAEEGNSNTAGSELQQLEWSNSALQKEIAALKKDLHRYTKALAHHEPHCRLRGSASRSRSTNLLSFSTSVDFDTSCSPPSVAPQASSSILASPPSVSPSVTSGLDLSPSASAPTAPTLSSSSGSPAELVIASSSSPLPYSVPAPHPLFGKEPPITTRPTNVTPVCMSLLSTSITSSTFTTADQPQSGQDLIDETSFVPANAHFSTRNPRTLALFLTKQTFLTSSSMVPPYSHLAAGNRGLLPHGCPVNVPELHPGQDSGKSNNSNPLCTHLPATPQDPALQSLTVSPQANLEQSPTFALKPGGRQEVTSNCGSLLSLLTVPSPLNVSQTASSSGGFICHPLPSVPLWDDPPMDPSLSELLEGNDWILSGTSNQ
ncbi:hypothetical protein F2P81_009623 [Scophthalmus maximus]|uniref:Uncharacterized protein n=1 Tax=Scophthalmus maximus TaxID=52904 RepID=A0A6A4T2G8_SCOMX|nr:hypothetical protein F2P81_009623 [Scophthalmus maximus]